MKLPTEAWQPLRRHELQLKLWRTKSRFVAVAAGRGSGKTELARRRVVMYLPVKKPWPDPIYFYALPTRDQAKRVAWKALNRLIPPEWIKKVHNSDMTVETIFGSTLYVIGMDKHRRAEGVQWDGGVLDESCDQKPEAFNISILPALSHRNPWCWRIGVPKRHGVGARDFKRFYDIGRNRDVVDSADNTNTNIIDESNLDISDDDSEVSLADLSVESYTWPSSDILTPQQLAFAQANLDAKDYNEQYNATWESASGAAFYAYSDLEAPLGNLDKDIFLHPKLPLIIGQDFNVDPMAWIIGQYYDARSNIVQGLNESLNTEHKKFIGKFCVIDELFIRNTNTPATLNELFKRFGDHQAGFHFYGDASGKARKTSASLTDYLLVKQDVRFRNSRIYFLKANPRVADRLAACNAMFCNAKGERRLFIHPKCKHLRQDLQERAFAEGTNELDDYSDLGHISDALGYPIHRMFPIRVILTDKKPRVLV